MHGRTSSLLLVFLVLGSLVPSDGFCVLPYSPSITRALALKGGQGITMSEGSHCKFSTADGQEVEGYMAGKKVWREKESAAGRVRREPSDTVGGVVVLLDVFGVRDEMNLRWMDRLAADTGLLVFAPDLFRYAFRPRLLLNYTLHAVVVICSAWLWAGMATLSLTQRCAGGSHGILLCMVVPPLLRRTKRGGSCETPLLIAPCVSS